MPRIRNNLITLLFLVALLLFACTFYMFMEQNRLFKQTAFTFGNRFFMNTRRSSHHNTSTLSLKSDKGFSARKDMDVYLRMTGSVPIFRMFYIWTEFAPT